MDRKDKTPPVVDLQRYRKAAEAERAAKAAARKTARKRGPTQSGKQPILGSRPKAGLILIAVILALLALTFLPTLGRA